MFGYDGSGNLIIHSNEDLGLPQIVGQPQDQVAAPGKSAAFAVAAANWNSLHYQWRFNGANLSDATADTLLLTAVSSVNEGQYSVVLVNSSGSVTSAPAALLLDADGDGLPDSWELTYFGGLGRQATGDFDHDGVSNLDEWLDGTNPTNSASAKYRLTVLADGGVIDVSPYRFSYTNGEIVTLTATPFPPNTFKGWTGDTNTIDNPLTLAMTTNRTVYARLGPQLMIWTNNASGDWHVASNWSPNFVPGFNDDVTINLTRTVSINAPAECRNLTLGDGVVSPTISGTSTLTLHGNSTWLSGVMSGGGRTLVDSGAVLSIFSSNSATLSTRTLENAGAILAGGSYGLAFSGGVNILTNRPGALFDLRGSGSLTVFSGTPRIDNAGTFRKSFDPSVAVINFPFNNYGALEIQSGEIRLVGGGLNTSNISVAVGSTIAFSGGTFTGNGSGSITGEGNLTVSGGFANLSGLVNVTGTNAFGSSTANLTGSYICTNNTLVVSGGAATFSGTGTISPSFVILSGGSLGGSQLITVQNQMNWTAGNMIGAGLTLIPPTAILNLANPGTVTLTTRTIENAGTTISTGAGPLNLNLGGAFTNRAGALFENQGSGGLILFSGSTRFDNAGTFRKTTSGGTMTISVPFNNYSTVDIQAGNLTLSGGGINFGTIGMPPGSTLAFSGGTFTGNPLGAITGAANLSVSGGVANLNGLVNLTGTNSFGGSATANLTGNYICTNNTLVVSGGAISFSGTGTVSPSLLILSGGSLGGSQLITVQNQMNWTAGNMAANGRTLIAPTATLNLANAGTVSMITRVLENAGTTLWTGAGAINFNTGGVITNRAGALFETRAAGSLAFFQGSGNRFDNAGTFRKSVNTGTTTITALLPFSNYGTVEVQTGTLAANGGYISTPNSIFNCAIGGITAGTGYGRLQVSGNVTLNGSLAANLINGFVPSIGDSFTVLTAGTRSGTFASFTYPSNQVTMQLSNTATSVIVRVTGVAAPVPPPLLSVPVLLGTNVLLAWTAVSNATYRLEFNPNLALSNWTALPGDVTATSNRISKLDTLTPDNRFYRVRVLP